MKKSLIVLLFLVGFLSTQAQNSPGIKFEQTTYNYGKIYQNADGNCEFKFTNNGKAPLMINSVVSTCGCTIPAWEKKPILPGKTETIKVKYDTRRLGAINKRITVQSNAEPAIIYLNIVGEVLKKPAEALPEKKLSIGASPMSN